jgi:hypothetical protein
MSFGSNYGYDTSQETEAKLDAMLELPILDAGCGYDWNELRAWYDEEARIFYWGEGSGCSCSYFWDDFNTMSDFSSGRREELLAAADSFIFNAYEKPDEESAAKFKAAVRAIKVG